MGCSPEEVARWDDEEPAHEITITKGFRIAMTPVTQQAFQRVTTEKRSHFKGANLPVETVNWYEANSYCKMIGGSPAVATSVRVTSKSIFMPTAEFKLDFYSWRRKLAAAC
jgi:formylglycine-generating enzyme required for sulfatase activity